jgi:hypothetical protein
MNMVKDVSYCTTKKVVDSEVTLSVFHMTTPLSQGTLDTFSSFDRSKPEGNWRYEKERHEYPLLGFRWFLNKKEAYWPTDPSKRFEGIELVTIGEVEPQSAAIKPTTKGCSDTRSTRQPKDPSDE